MGTFWSLRAAVVIVAAGLFASSAFADDSARIAALEAKIAKLEAQQSRADLAIAQSQAIDRAIADADSKTPFLLADGFTSGWDNGFKLGSADGDFLLQPFIQFQFRNVTNYTDEASDGSSDFENGFEVRRLEFGAHGNVFNKDLTYYFRFAVNRNNGSITPDYAYAQYKFADDWAVRLGQFKLNWTHEQTTGFTKQLAVERSLLDQLAGGGQTGYVQGVSLLYGSKENAFRGEVQLTDGDDTANTNFTDQFDGPGEYQNFGVAVRGEYKVMGDWESYADFSALKTESEFLVVGGGVDWAEGGDGDVYRFTVDGQYENPDGLGVYGSVIYTLADGDTGDVVLDKSVGGLAQAGYLLPGAREWEVFGRYDILHLDEDVGGDNNFQEITAGVNRYYYGHAAKLTIDAGWYPSGSFTSASGLGLTSGAAGNQFVVRAQFQLAL